MLWPQTGFGLKRIVRNDSHEVPTGTIQTLIPSPNIWCYWEFSTYPSNILECTPQINLHSHLSNIECTPQINIECLFDSVGTVCISTNLNLNITYLQGKEVIVIYISCTQCKFNLDHQGLVAQRNSFLYFIDQGLNHPSSIVVTY